MNENSIDVRSKDELEKALVDADRIVNKKYLKRISDFSIKEMESSLKIQNVNSILRLNKVDRIIYDAEENINDKLMSVYNAVFTSGGSLVNVLISDGSKVDFYIGTKSNEINNIASCQAVLTGTFEGNFPGSSLTLQKKSDIEGVLSNIFSQTKGERNRAISVVNGIPGLRNENKDETNKYIQGLEKVIDSMRGHKFALVTIADPVSSKDIWDIKSGYENLYSQLSPFASTNLTFSESESDSIAQSLSTNFTNTYATSISNTMTNSTSTSNSLNESKSHSKNFNMSMIFVGGSLGNSTTTGSSYSTTSQSGKSSSETQNKSSSKGGAETNTNSQAITNGRTLQLNIENKQVKNLLESIDKQIKRIDDATEQGLWNASTYCIADDSHTSKILANAVGAICRGEKNTIEDFSIGTWDNNIDRNRVLEYLEKFSHPILEMESNRQRIEINPTTLISGKELVIEAGLPLKSVSGIPVTQMVSFSRNIVSEGHYDKDRTISLGKVYHMGREEETEANLSIESLSAHTLITGSTGSGKSNTVYNIISELEKQDVKFLVVEPAKGEYKHCFGNRKDVNVFGTNEKFTELLKINPFAFPESIHVLEHTDRLIEIFNVCWPMYAAMPAILKDALLLSYERCGWNLSKSENEYGNNVFPSFKDLLNELTEVINKSGYSEENKSNYIGALATRIKSLINGINGRVFTSNTLTDQVLFEQNTIIDLSRVGSTETKSLIMGIVIMKLNEYRMDQAGTSMNNKLKHITILEEAHNILKNSTNVDSSSEGGNVSGKSVEMLANSIAEMRTYGEGFIIVDQSPNAIDISAIRNTNTKIIMRLPEEVDRQQAGKSAALSEQQIPELAKLSRGVAVIYQNDWLDPVLCKIKKSDVAEDVYVYTNRRNAIDNLEGEIAEETLKFLMKYRVDENIESNLEKIIENIESLNISTRNKLEIKKAISEVKDGKPSIIKDEGSFELLSNIVVDILGCSGDLYRFSRYGDNYERLQDVMNKEINKIVRHEFEELKFALSQCILRELVEKDNKQIELYSNWREYAVNNRKVI